MKLDIVDGNTAAAHVAYAFSDVAFIYPITPSSTMAELVDLWASQGRKNLFGQKVDCREMQSEAGAAGAVHGSLAAGALTTTFTASQGLLLMIPNMYKIAGELMPCVFHVSARAVAGQALSIFGDHSDVMAIRQCGWGMLSSHSVQEASDMALIAHLATLEGSVPFVHFFDGFRTSHELQKIEILDYEQMQPLFDDMKSELERHRAKALNPTHPHQRGTSQGPDVFFQCVEASNPFYAKLPEIVEGVMAKVAPVIGRTYRLFMYYGHEQADRCVVVMGAGAPVLEECVNYLNSKGEKVGLIKVHLFRPWKADALMAAIPDSVQRIAVLDRTKESGSFGEPLFLDVAATLQDRGDGRLVVGGRYGLGSKDFTPAMAKAVYDNLAAEKPKRRFTVGIKDDVSNMSLELGPEFRAVPEGTVQCMFWGMGSDGTVGANKNAIKIIGSNTPLYVQGYFAYDAHKSGGVTVSHLRFGPHPITSQYLLQDADYVAVHHQSYVKKFKVLQHIRHGGNFVLNCPWTRDELETELPASLKRTMAAKSVQFYTMDAAGVARETGMGKRINNILMVAFLKLSNVLPFEQAVNLLKSAIQKTYGRKGEAVVHANWRAVDAALDAIVKVEYDASEWASATDKKVVDVLENAPTFVTEVMMPVERLEGDTLPVSKFQPGGFMPLGTSAFEKRNIALQVPTVDMDKCTQCNYCSFVCPHAAVRPFLITEDEADDAPEHFVTKKAKGGAEMAGFKYRIQVSPMDCTGCELCVHACPDNALTLYPVDNVIAQENPNWDFALTLPSRGELFDRSTVKGSQFQKPLLEFSGACEGCGETPYVKLLTQLFGERMLIANATGCSSIWGGSYPAVPYCVNDKGQGPAWGNSLFEDNAEYGFGMAVALNQRRQRLHELVQSVLQGGLDISDALREQLVGWEKEWRHPAKSQAYYETLPPLLEKESGKHPLLERIYTLRDLLPKFSHWIVGGDGWAYDIGYGGLDHVLASGENVNILVLDTEVYSNTGGQMSKATPLGAIAKFGQSGKKYNKKDLGMMAMAYGNVYVASCALGANYSQVIRAFVEAESHEGPSLIMCYAPCSEHGYLVSTWAHQADDVKIAVESGYWLLYRYNPELEDKGENPLQLDAKKLKVDVRQFMERENRFASLMRAEPEVATKLQENMSKFTKERFNRMKSRSQAPGGIDSAQLNATFEALQQGLATGGVQAGPGRFDVLFGSETGNAEEVAKRVGGLLKGRGYKVKVRELDEVEVDELAELKFVLVICSTAGQGEFPQNAKDFWTAVSDPTLDDTVLKDLHYGVFGLGDSSYCFFNQAAKMIDEQFAKLGATRLLPCGLGDDQDEERYDTALGEWLPDFWTEIKAPAPLHESDELPPPNFAATPLDAATCTYEQCVPQGAVLLRLTENTRITPDDYDKDVRHLEFDLTGTNFRYGLGDSLAIFPQNDPKEVEAFCNYMGYDADLWVQFSKSDPTQSNARYDALFKKPMTIRQLCVECLDLFGRPTRHFYESLQKCCTDSEEKSRAKHLVSPEGKPEMRKLTDETVHCFDVLQMFPSAKPTLEQLIDMVPLLKPRYYSIASSQRYLGGNRLQLCIGIVDWKTPSGKYRVGECTGYVTRTPVTETSPPIFYACSLKATTFNLPPNDRVPVIMASMGTGLAPFRAFVQHRAFLKRQGKQVGPMTMYFGCRYSKKDYLYGDELQQFAEEGVIDELRVAFSREQKEKFYVQHHITRDPALLYRRFIEERGYFYLCGQSRQVPIDIRNAVLQALQSEGGMTDKEATDKLIDMQIRGRYNVEAWS